jgi:transposase
MEPEQLAKMCDMITAGKSSHEVMEAFGVSNATYYTWKKRLAKGMNGYKNGKKNPKIASGSGDALENAIIDRVRQRIRSDVAFASTLIDCLSAKI